MSGRRFTPYVAAIVLAVAATSGAQDPDIKSGFPVSAFSGSGTFAGWPFTPVFVDLTSDTRPEIVFSGIASGPLFAWQHNGSLAPGFPVSAAGGYQFATAVSTGGPPSLVFSQIFSGPSSGTLALYSGTGTVLPGWPRQTANYVSSPASAYDLDGDGVDEIICGSENRRVSVFTITGQSFPGWPVQFPSSSQKMGTPFVADVDLDSYPDLICSTGQASGFKIFTRNRFGQPLPSAPDLTVPEEAFLAAVADLDGDEIPEYLCLTGGYWRTTLLIYKVSGVLWIRKELSSLYESSYYYAGLAVADITGGPEPEIVISNDDSVRALTSSGMELPGWPKRLNALGLKRYPQGPYVGDVDGDGLQDLVVIAWINQTPRLAEVWVFDREGNVHPRTPKICEVGMTGSGGICDLDNDGKNEIVVMGNSSNGITPYKQGYAYDLNADVSGGIEWPLVFGGSGHGGYYLPRSFNALPSTLSMLSGTVLVGDVDALRRSDGSLLVLGPQYAVPRGAPNIVGEVTIQVPEKSLTAGAVWLNARATGSPVLVAIEARDATTGLWIPAGSVTLDSALQEGQVSLAGPIGRWIARPTRKISLRLKCFGAGTGARWQVLFDRFWLRLNRK